MQACVYLATHNNLMFQVAKPTLVFIRFRSAESSDCMHAFMIHLHGPFLRLLHSLSQVAASYTCTTALPDPGHHTVVSMGAP